MQTKTEISTVLVGSDSLLTECGEVLFAQGHHVVAVVSAEPRVLAWARSHHVETIESLRSAAGRLAELDFDFLFSIANLSIIPDALLELPHRGAINFHDGPLPRYAGLNAPAWALIHGERRHGVTWHAITAGVDEGAIFKQAEVRLSPRETSLSLNARCFELGIETFEELVRELSEGRERSQAQDLTQRSYFGRHQRPALGCALDFSRTAVELDRLVRALDFGPYDNPLGVPKLYHGGRLVTVTRSRVVDGAPPAPSGTLLDVRPEGWLVCTGEGSLQLSGFSSLQGEARTPEQAACELGITKGSRLDAVPDAARLGFEERGAQLARAEGRAARWYASGATSPEVVGLGASRGEPPAPGVVPLELSAQVVEQYGSALDDAVHAAFALLLCRMSDRWELLVSYWDETLRPQARDIEPWVGDRVVQAASLDADAPFAAAVEAIARCTRELREQGPVPRDVWHRFSTLRGKRLPEVAVLRGNVEAPSTEALALHARGAQSYLHFDANRLSLQRAREMARELSSLLEATLAEPDAPIGFLSLVGADERSRLCGSPDAADAGAEVRCVHRHFETEATRHPDRPALTFGNETLSYAELSERANRLAHALVAAGIGPDRLVGIHLDRSVEMVVAVLAVLKAGGAYVPLDPAYPRGRIELMLEDSQASVVITTAAHAARLGAHQARFILVDGDAEAIAARPSQAPVTSVTPEHLAYVIYTSGSTGRPKGVMVEHRNVDNFFAGMDPLIEHDRPGVWLAVTSLSFDISVLELLYTLGRGFHVILYREPGAGARASARPIDFSLFMWGSDDGVTRNKYRLMLEAARFADARGFAAVWTPERHFHAFGGPFPNPSVTSAAMAAITHRVQLRAGSCVLPLHHPARVAEEWAVVDNLSNGRAAISFASGWQPNDFLFRPENFSQAKDVMMRDIDVVRRLWRGEAVEFDAPRGPVSIVTQPRPVQPELPLWVTTAGNPETYRMAGEMGANLLTHLLGQTIEELGKKIAIYRDARERAGLDPETGTVSLMLHTFVGDDDASVRELVRSPMKSYLASATSLLKSYAWSFPAFKRPKGAESATDLDLSELGDSDFDAVLEHAFQRYFTTSGLFGSVETCLSRVEELRAIGVDDVACMIDYGVDVDQVLGGLEALDRVRSASGAAAPADDADDLTIAGLIERHAVTHLQCTPSLAKMLVGDPDARRALGRLRHLMVGGEALTPSLARDLVSLGVERVTNMYGPTETTIWSTTQAVDGRQDPVPIGRPIANTFVYVVDRRGNLVPDGWPGELVIAGSGVVRGYLGRPELTKERFVSDPGGDPGGRAYRTGDLVRRAGGVLEFLGRLDHQVKLRGYRIELGEIEALLVREPGVREAVVMAREDVPGDQRLVAYLVPQGGVVLEARPLRAALEAKLPAFMVPSAFVTLSGLPLTPNGKVDRAALPPPGMDSRDPDREIVEPRTEMEQAILAIWTDELALDTISISDDFFDVGGHSLLAAQVIARIREQFGTPMSLAALFQLPSPTIEHLAALVEEMLLDEIDSMTDEQAASLLETVGP